MSLWRSYSACAMSKVFCGHEASYGQLALHDHRERGSLHAADRKNLVAIRQRIGARKIHPDEPVCAAAAARGICERIVVSAGPQRIEPFADRIGGER